MAQIFMIPVDGTVVIDGLIADGVNFAGINPSIHAINWYGTIGEIQFKYQYTPGVNPPQNQEIDSIAPYQAYINQAQDIISARLNPIVVYSTSSDTLFQGNIYPLGEAIVITTPNTPPPAQTTPSVPPTPESWQTLQWTGSEWIMAPFAWDIGLSEAQAICTNLVYINAANAVNTQSRIYSNIQLFAASNPAELVCADFVELTLGDYQTYIDTNVAVLLTQISEATVTSDLYDFNPTVNEVP